MKSKIKNILSILLAVLFVVSATAVTVSANTYAGTGGGYVNQYNPIVPYPDVVPYIDFQVAFIHTITVAGCFVLIISDEA